MARPASHSRSARFGFDRYRRRRGFALQEATLPFSSPEEMAAASEQMLVRLADVYPHLARVQRELVASGFDYADEFEAGLDIILDALPEPG